MRTYIYCFVVFMMMIAQTNGQDTIYSGMSYSQTFDSMIVNLDKSEITTGILQERSYASGLMNVLTGDNDSIIISGSTFRDAYSQIYNASLSDTLLPPPDTLDSITRGYLKEGIIPISIIDISYHGFNEYAIDSNLLEFTDGKLYDVANRNQSPYLEKRLFAAAALKGNVYCNGEVNFKLVDELYISNRSVSVTGVEIDFDDGLGWRAAARGDDFTAAYLTTGIKTMQIRVEFSDNTETEIKSEFTIKTLLSVEPDLELSVDGTWNGGTRHGVASVLYGCGHSQIEKPVIVIDGFDPNIGTEIRHFPEIYDAMNDGQHLIEKLIADGFDVIVLDPYDGGDFVQRNAHMLYCLLNQINARLSTSGSNAQITIIGPSMGGLIARYALSYMEQNNVDHNVGLYISWDAPHKGANIPIGDQYWLNFFAIYTEVQPAVEGIGKLNTPAARQMLVYQHLTYPNTSSFRTNLLNDMYFSYPTKCRMVAIANGSGNSELWFDPCDPIVHYEHIDDFGVHLVGGNAWAAPANGTCVLFHGWVPSVYLFGEIPLIWADEWRFAAPSVAAPFDNAPGGGFGTNAFIANGSPGHGDILTDHPNHCFIPTISALDIIITNNLYYNVLTELAPYGYPYINDPSITPFDAIYAPVLNQAHTLVTAENAAWMRNEISAFDLFLQNQTIETNALFEARNSITMGRDVTNTVPIGDFVVTNTASVTIHAGEQINIEDGTIFENGSDVFLYIQPYDCPSEWRRANPKGNTDYDSSLEIESISTHTFSKKNSFIQSYPNPCKDRTNIQYSIGESGQVEILVYDIFSQRMKVLENNFYHSTGQFITAFDASQLSAGTYICLLKTDGTITSSLKIIVAK